MPAARCHLLSWQEEQGAWDSLPKIFLGPCWEASNGEMPKSSHELGEVPTPSSCLSQQLCPHKALTQASTALLHGRVAVPPTLYYTSTEAYPDARSSHEPVSAPNST